MSRQIANFIDVIPTSDVESISGSTITPKSGKSLDRIWATNNLVPDESPGVDRGNSLFNQSLKLITDKLTADLSARYRNRRPVVVLLYTIEGSAILWGDIGVPVRVNLSPKPDRDQLDFTRSAVDSLL